MRPHLRLGPLPALLLALGLALVAMPVVLVLLVGLGADGSLAFPPGRPALARVRDLLGHPAWSAALGRSLAVAAVASLGGLLLATAAALAARRLGGWRAAAFEAGVVAPAVVPVVVYALGLVLGQRLVPVPSPTLLTLGHVILTTPLAFLVMRVGVALLRPELAEAARLLGASRRLVAWSVVVPQLLPFAAVAWAIAASVSLAEPILAIFLLGDGSATLPQRSFQGLRFGFDPLIFTAAALLVVVTLGAVALASATWLLTRRRASRAAGGAGDG